MSTPITVGPVSVGGGSTVIFTNAGNTYAGGTTVNAASSLQVTTDNELGNAAGGVTLGDTTPASGTLNLSTSLAFTSARTFTIDAGGGTILFGSTGTTTLSGALSGTGALTVNGTGTLVLSGASGGYTGDINLTGGTLSIASSANLGTGTLAMYGGTTLNFTAAGTYTTPVTLSGDPTFNIASGTVTYNGLISDGINPGTLNLTGGGTLYLTDAANNYSGGTSVIGGSTLQVAVDTALGNVNGQLALGNSTTTGTLDTIPSLAPITTARNIQIGNFGGTIEMGTNSWSLGGNIYGGPLTVTNPGNLGVAGTSGELILTNAGNSFNALTVNDNGIVQAATNGDLGNGIITLGDATHPGTLDFSTATGTVTESNAIVLNPGGGIFYTNQNTNFWTLSGVISNGSTAAGLTLNGGGTLALTGINTYSGGTTINGGSTLEISADLNLGAVPVAGTPNVVNLNNGGTLALYGYAASQRTITVGTTIGGGGAIDTTGGGTWTFTTPVAGTTLSGPGALTIGGTGTLILDTVGNTLPGGTIVSAGTLEIGDSNTPGATLISPVTISGGTLTGYGTVTGNVNITSGTLTGYGTIAGSVTNTGGTVATGTGGGLGPLTITGNYTAAGGTTAIGVTPAGAAKLVVGGNVNFTGSTLVLNFSGNFQSQTIQLIQAGSITCGSVGGGCITFNANTLSAEMKETLSFPGGGVVDLTLLQLALPAINIPTIFPEITTTAIDEAQAANDTILTRLTDLRTEAVVDDMPMAESTSHRPGLSAGRSPYGAWMKALGGWGTTTGSDAPTYLTHGEGFIAGFDNPISQSAILGAAVEYTTTTIQENGNATATIGTPRLLAYGGWWRGPVALDGAVGLGYASIDSSRPVAGYTAASTYTGTELTAAFQASTPTHLGPIAITPAIGVDYAWLSQKAVTESGAGIYDFNMLQTKTNSFRPFVAATFSTRFDLGSRNVAVEPQLRVAYEDEMINSSRSAMAQPVGDSQVFSVPGVTPASGFLFGSAGLKIETGRSLAFSANFDVIEAGPFRGYGGDATVRYRF